MSVSWLKTSIGPLSPSESSRIPLWWSAGFPRAAHRFSSFMTSVLHSFLSFPCLTLLQLLFSCSFLNTTRLFPPQKLSTCYSSAWTTINPPYGLLPHFLKIFQLSSLYLKLQSTTSSDFLPFFLTILFHNIDDYRKSFMFCLSIYFLFLDYQLYDWQLFCFFYSLLYPQPSNSDAW